MAGTSVARALVALFVLAPGPAPAHAQPPDTGVPERPRFTFGADLSASLAPADDDAFFNYTDYEQDGLRVARARLFGEWRVTAALQAVAELRLETGRDVDLAAWYLRWRPRQEWALDVQAGRIPPVFGAFARRAYGRDNPVVGLPLAYSYLTSIRADAAPRSIGDLQRMRGRGWQPSYPLGSQAAGPGLALVSATEWSTGVQARWRGERLEIAAALTQGALSRPRALDADAGPHWSGRLALNLPGGVLAGLSGARGRWLERDLTLSLPATLADATETAVGVDVEYGRGPWLFRGEWIRTVHDLPLAAPRGVVLDLRSHTGFAEVRWRPHPRWQVAGRADYLRFASIDWPAADGGPWDAPIERLEAAVNYRATRRLDVRAGWQHNWRDGGRVRSRGFPIAAVLFWF